MVTLGEGETEGTRLHVLSGALRAFAEATTQYERLLEVVAHTVAGAVADACIVRLLTDGGWLAPVAHHLPLESHVTDAEARARVNAFMLTRRNVDEYAWGQHLVNTGEPFLLPRLEASTFRASVRADVADIYATMGIHSLLVVALRLRGETIGTLSLFRYDADSPSFDARDMEMAQALADHAALAIGNARSYAAERAARDLAEKATARFARLSESGVVGTIVFDLNDGRVVDINDALLSMVGYSREDFSSGRVAWKSLTPPEWDEVDARAISQLATSGVAGLREKEFIRKDGRRVPVVAGSAMLGDGSTECISFVLDLTERKEAERGRREAERRSQRIVESATVGMWMLDAERRTTFMNPRMADILGVRVADALVAPFSSFFPEEDHPMLDERWRERKAGVATAYEQRFRRADGTTGVLWIEASPLLDQTGACEGVIGIVTDITARRDMDLERLRLEEQLRQAQKMEAVGRLAGGVAHDFNNLLSVVLSYAELMLADLAPEDPTRTDVEEIKKAGERARDLTRQLLMFSRQQVMAPKVLDLNDVLLRMDKMLQRILGADVDLVSRPSRPLGRVRADPTSVEQVIMNLVVNARDAMPTGGKLTMETANVVLDEAYAEQHLGVKVGPHVMLAVTDTGTGMEKAVLARIFEPFFTTKGSGKGTGLGLSTVFGIVQQCGGSVWVYSEVGKGTVFKVYFPRVDAETDSGHELAGKVARRGSETILLVEDDDQVRAVVRGILRRSGYHIIEAASAGEALLHGEQHPGTIHLLLTDVVMPQMSGPTLARRLAGARPEMKVLCMSGYTDDSIVRHGVLDARIAYLQKPITPETLTSKVREVLDGPDG
jgi:PAS domain S-box-containing protein